MCDAKDHLGYVDQKGQEESREDERSEVNPGGMVDIGHSVPGCWIQPLLDFDYWILDRRWWIFNIERNNPRGLFDIINHAVHEKNEVCSVKNALEYQIPNKSRHFLVKPENTLFKRIRG